MTCDSSQSEGIFLFDWNESYTAWVDLYSPERIRAWTLHPRKADRGSGGQYRRLQAIPGFRAYLGEDHEELGEIG